MTTAPAELPRDFMRRAAQCGRRGLFQYHDRHVPPGWEHLRFVGATFATAEAARRWDDSGTNLTATRVFPSWDDGLAWLYAEEEVEA